MVTFISLSIVFGVLALISLVFLGIRIRENRLLGLNASRKDRYLATAFASLFIIFAAACALCAALPMHVGL